MFMAFLCPEISKIKNAKNSPSEISQIICSLLRSQQFYKVILSEQLLVLLLLAPIGTSSQILKLKDQKIVFRSILQIILKISKTDPSISKIRKSEHDTQILC